MNELEEAILKKMEQEEGAETDNENLTPSESDNISEGEYSPPKIKSLTKKGLSMALDQIEGVTFKFGDAYFKIIYINKGKGRFTAEVVNEVVDTKTDPVDYIEMNRRKGKKNNDADENNDS